MGFIRAPSILKNRITVILLCTAMLLLPLSSLRKMGLLRFASLGCLLAIGVFVVVMVLMGSGVIEVDHTGEDDPRLFQSSLIRVVGQLPVVLFAYNCNMNVPILYGELRRQSNEDGDSRYSTKRSKMMASMHASLLICGGLYCVAAAAGCLAFRTS